MTSLCEYHRRVGVAEQCADSSALQICQNRGNGKGDPGRVEDHQATRRPQQEQAFGRHGETGDIPTGREGFISSIVEVLVDATRGRFEAGEARSGRNP